MTITLLVVVTALALLIFNLSQLAAQVAVQMQKHHTGWHPKRHSDPSKEWVIEGVRTSWGVVDLPGRPYALAVMGNYGETDEIAEKIEAIARLSHWYFSRLAGATEYGTRVPLELLEAAE